ncbi:type VI secretion system baseplate subunit TssF [Pendulispora albinea]|uniref:Type VI secretion system baseplate subunit TssF n=1 Tax=Pendulispora albinea TaxID=2741071 RepID=A0ABZ2LNZ5_9BACT
MARFPESALRTLLISAREFAQAHPALAGRLGRPSSEPQVERFRQGLFHLGATLLEQSRRFEGESYRALGELVAPDLSRPFPAATLVELSDASHATHVPAGALVHTPSGCIFTLAAGVDLGPYRAERARLTSEGLSFDLAATAAVPLAHAVGDDLRIYVDGPRESALALVEHVLRHTASVTIELPGAQVRKSVKAAEPYGLRAEDALAPEPDGPPTGAQFLREYFLLPQKFAFFRLPAVRAALRGAGARATVTLRFDAPIPTRGTLGEDDLRVHAVPATNLFRATSEPRTVDPAMSRFPLRVAGFSRERASVYAVTRVAAVRRDGGGPSIVVPPLRRFAAAAAPGEFPYAFSTELVKFRGRPEPDLVVSITSPHGEKPLLEPHVLMVDLLATHRDRAADLRPGDRLEGGPGIPHGARIRSLTPASPYVPAPAGPEFALHALHRGAVPQRDPRASLQRLLLGRLPRQGVDPALVRANLARIRAIEALDVSIASRGAHRGYRATLTLDETSFRGQGDVALFARVLHAVLDAQTSLNRFYECDILCKRSGSTVRWPRSVRS